MSPSHFFYMTEKSRQKFKYLENKKTFSNEIKSIFHHFWKANNKIFFSKWESDFKYYNIPPVEIKDFDGLIYNKLFFIQPVKNRQEAFEKLQMSENNDCLTGNLLNYSYHQIVRPLILNHLFMVSHLHHKNIS